MPDLFTLETALELFGKITEFVRDRQQDKAQNFSDWLQMHHYSRLKNMITENKQLANESARKKPSTVVNYGRSIALTPHKLTG